MSKGYAVAGGLPDTVQVTRSDRPTIFGPGVLVDANIFSSGTVQVFGRLRGDICAARLIIGEGAHVEGNVLASDAIVQGNFKGIIQGTTVQLQGRARIEGEIYNESLSIEPGVVFKGTSYRLDDAAEPAPAIDVDDQDLDAMLGSAIEPLGLVTLKG